MDGGSSVTCGSDKVQSALSLALCLLRDPGTVALQNVRKSASAIHGC